MIQNTSLEIYFQIIESGMLSRKREKFYKFIYNSGPVTASQIFFNLNEKCNQSGRILELEQLGVIRKLPFPVICPITKHSAYQYVTTNNLPQKQQSIVRSNKNAKKQCYDLLDDIYILQSERVQTKIEQLRKLIREL